MRKKTRDFESLSCEFVTLLNCPILEFLKFIFELYTFEALLFLPSEFSHVKTGRFSDLCVQTWQFIAWEVIFVEFPAFQLSALEVFCVVSFRILELASHAQREAQMRLGTRYLTRAHI